MGSEQSSLMSSKSSECLNRRQFETSPDPLYALTRETIKVGGQSSTSPDKKQNVDGSTRASATSKSQLQRSQTSLSPSQTIRSRKNMPPHHQMFKKFGTMKLVNPSPSANTSSSVETSRKQWIESKVNEDENIVALRNIPSILPIISNTLTRSSPSGHHQRSPTLFKSKATEESLLHISEMVSQHFSKCADKLSTRQHLIMERMRRVDYEVMRSSHALSDRHVSHSQMLSVMVNRVVEEMEVEVQQLNAILDQCSETCDKLDRDMTLYIEKSGECSN